MNTREIKTIGWEIDAQKISNGIPEMSEKFEKMFPGLMGSKDAEKSMYEGVSGTTVVAENKGFFWSKKLNEKIILLMSFYPILQIHAKQNLKLMKLMECLTVK